MNECQIWFYLLNTIISQCLELLPSCLVTIGLIQVAHERCKLVPQIRAHEWFILYGFICQLSHCCVSPLCHKCLKKKITSKLHFDLIGLAWRRIKSRFSSNDFLEGGSYKFSVLTSRRERYVVPTSLFLIQLKPVIAATHGVYSVSFSRKERMLNALE